jgi:fumarate reductase subunit C
VTTLVFLQTMLNPNSAFVSAFQSPNMVILSVVVIVFCILSTAVWFYLQRLEKSEAAKIAAGSTGGAE